MKSTHLQFTGPRDTVAAVLLSIGIVGVSGCGGAHGELAIGVRTCTPAAKAATIAFTSKPSKPGCFSGVITTDAKSSSGKPPNYVAKKFCMAPKVAKKIVDDSLVVGPKGGLSNAFVYIPRKPNGYTPPPIKGTVKFTNKNCMFTPRVLSVRVGQTVTVGNDDATSHNTHTNPVIGTGFNQNVPKNCMRFNYDAPEPLPVKVNCNIHGWMLGWHLPLDHDLVAITDKNGKFIIKNIPPGSYRFRIWHERAGFLERGMMVTIAPGKTVTKKLSYMAAIFSAVPNLRTKSIAIR